MIGDPFERNLEIEQAQLRGFARSIADVEWLLLILVMLYLFVTKPPLANVEIVIGSLVLFTAAALVFRYGARLRRRTYFKITLEILVMVAFLSAVLSQIGGETNSLVNLYLLPIITAALTLGKRATVLVVVLVCVCYFMLATLRGGIEVLSVALASQAVGALAPFLLVAFLTTLLAENIHTAKARIKALSDRDELTNIYNIRAFMRLAGREHHRARGMESAYSILMVDLDQLKKINDTHGHEAGNRAVRLVADALTRITRSADLVSRFGGDEFVVYLNNASRAIAEEVGQRVRNVVFATTLEVEASIVRVKVSVGVATFPEDGATLEALLSAADSAMYKDKECRKPPKGKLVIQKL